MYNNNNYQIEKTYTNETYLALIALNISLCYLILTAVPSQLQCSMIILTKKVALIFRCASISWFEVVSRSVIDIFTASASTDLSDYFFKVIRDIAHEPFKTTVLLCPYVEMTLNLKWLVSRCHMLIGVGYCQNINCDENEVLSIHAKSGG